ncbi:MAG: trypsin-like peptidase domain-containing protein, partial [Caldilineaceae bacterium]
MKTKLVTIVLTALFTLSAILPASVWAAPAADLSTVATSVARIEVFDSAGDVIGVGSGSIIDSRGLVLTNYHVIEASAETNYMVGVQVPTSVRSNEFTPYSGYVSAVDAELDLAVVQIVATLDWKPVEALTFPALALGDSDALELGEEVIAIGYPDISVLHLATTRGNIAGFMEDPGWILSDVVTSNGNSGGALTNLNEELVAIPSMVNTGANSGSTMSYARPVNLAMPLIETALGSYEKVANVVFSQSAQTVGNHSPA